MSSEYPKLLSPLAMGIAHGFRLMDAGHWRAPEAQPQDVCVTCGHFRSSHLDQPYVKGGPPVSDRGWCTLPEGRCIFHPCSCTHFVEATEEQLAQAMKELEDEHVEAARPLGD